MMTDEIRQRMTKMIEQVGFDFVFMELLKVSRPRTPSQRDRMTFALRQGLAISMAWEAHWHIEDHGGYTCAKELIDELPPLLHRDAEEMLSHLLELHGNAPVSKSVNEQTYESILKEMSNE